MCVCVCAQWNINCEKEGKFAIFNNMDGSWRHYAKWKKSDRKTQLPHVRSKKSQTYRNSVDWWLPGALGKWWAWEMVFTTVGVSSWGDENILKLIVVMGEQLCEYTKNHWIMHLKGVNSIPVKLFYAPIRLYLPFFPTILPYLPELWLVIPFSPSKEQPSFKAHPSNSYGLHSFAHSLRHASNKWWLWTYWDYKSTCSLMTNNIKKQKGKSKES